MKTYGTIEYNWQDLGTKKSYGNVWFDLWKKYDEEKKNDIGKKSALYIKTNRQGRGKMKKIQSTDEMNHVLVELLNKSSKQLVKENAGKMVFFVDFAIGIIGDDDSVMDESSIEGSEQQKMLTQDSFGSLGLEVKNGRINKAKYNLYLLVP